MKFGSLKKSILAVLIASSAYTFADSARVISVSGKAEVDRNNSWIPLQKDALINETIQGSFTTAAKAAHILGMFKVKHAAFCLEKSLDSPDYLLSGEAMVALALMGETKAQTLIARKLADTGNAYVLLSGIHAMEIYANAASVPVLLDILRAHPERSDVQHEVMLALASVMGIGNSFYPAYCQYIESSDSASVILHDLFDETAARKKLKNGVFPPLIGVFFDQTLTIPP